MTIDEILETTAHEELGKLNQSFEDMSLEELEEILEFLVEFRFHMEEFQASIDDLIAGDHG